MAIQTSVTTDDVAVALGVSAPTPLSAQWKQWSMWANDALMLIQIRAAKLGIDTLDETTVDYVVREAVVAQIKRPDSATQVTVSVDDGSTSKSYRSGTGRVGIIDEWWAMLGLAPDGGEAFTIDTLGTSTVHADTCSLNFGALYCSCGASIAGFPLWGV